MICASRMMVSGSKRRDGPETLTAAVIDTYKDRGALIDNMERETSADGVKNVMALIHKYARPYK